MINEECKYLISRTMANNERILKCKLDANQDVPFACPEGCVFFERKTTSSAGWQVGFKRPKGKS